MSIRRVTCPGCGATANVPAAMANVKCPACGMVWNAQNPPASKASASKTTTAGGKPAAVSAEAGEEGGTGTATAAMFAGLVGGGMLLMAMVGLLVMILHRDPVPSETALAEVEDTIKPAIPEPYREISLPEATRKRIYNDYRQVARTSIEKPLILPQGTKVRASLENMLQSTFDRELMRFAALHDISVEDVKEVIKEGDAKVWDKSPRSNAVRDGKRVYTKEMSEGWKKNPNRK